MYVSQTVLNLEGYPIRFDYFHNDGSYIGACAIYIYEYEREICHDV